jgi:DNA polymerase III sliding clamp (beta) subunit (PCNA family)
MLIPRNCLKAVSLAMAKDDIRYYLNGMLVECNGQTVRLVATDGYRLHIMDVPQPEPAEGEAACPALPEGVIVPRALVDWALKNSKKGQIIELTVIPDPPAPGTPAVPVLQITANSASMTAPALDGQFLDYLRVLPHELSGEAGQFNPAYVSDAYAAVLELADVRKNVTYAAELKHNGDGAALMVYERFAAVIMPWRITEADIDPGLLAPI